MAITGVLVLLIFPILLVAALVVGLVIFFVVRRNERKKREEFQRIHVQEAQRRTQEKELEKMKIDDL